MKITRVLSITTGVAPYTVTVSGCPCTTITDTIFTVPASGLYPIEIEFASPDCYDACEVTVTVTDADNCVEALDFTSLDNPCTGFEVEISNNGYKFGALLVSYPIGTPDYTYQWSYPKNVFKSITGSDDQATLYLEIRDDISGPIAGVYSVSLFVTDAVGCTAIDTIAVEVCKPISFPSSEYVSIPCLSQGVFDLQARGCTDRRIDWTTLEFTKVLNSDGDEVVNKLFFNQDSGYGGRGTILYNTDDIPLLNNGGSFTVYWRVADDLGVFSAEASFPVYVSPCLAESPSKDFPTNSCKCNKRAECYENNGEDPIYLEIDMSSCFDKCDCEDSSKDVDPNSFHVINGPYIPGAYYVFNPGNLILQYFAPAGSAGVDIIEYTICNNGGQCSGISTLNVFLNCIAPPTLVDDEVCGTCLEPITINVLANDSGQNLNPASLQITELPSFGNVYIDVNFNVVYTPFINYSGEDSFKYIVYNYGGQGGQPEPATVTITISCAGNGQPLVICDVEPAPIAAISADIICNNDVNKGEFAITLGGWVDNNGVNVALSDGDLITLQSATLGLNVELIVGQNPMTAPGYQNDAAGNWALLFPYLTSGGVMTASSLLSNSYVFEFDKKAWAEAGGYYNIYDTTSGAQTQNAAVEIDLDSFVTDVSEGDDSPIVSAMIKKVKINAFEDTSKPGYSIKPKGVGTWTSTTGAAPTTNCDSDCVAGDDINSWYSQTQGSCDTPYLTIPPSEITSYKKVGEAAVALSPGYPITLGNAENDVVLALNTFGAWSFKYVSCAVAALATFGVKGYNGTFVVSCYMEDNETSLEYFELTYVNGTANEGKIARMSLDSIVLF